jgi:hypothetical protein
MMPPVDVDHEFELLRSEFDELRGRLGPYRSHLQQMFLRGGSLATVRQLVADARDLTDRPDLARHTYRQVNRWLAEQTKSVNAALSSADTGKTHGDAPEDWVSEPNAEEVYSIASTFGNEVSAEGEDRGFHIFQSGRTGAPAGRPRHGTKDAVVAERRLLDCCPGRSMEELRRCVRRGGRARPHARLARSSQEPSLLSRTRGARPAKRLPEPCNVTSRRSIVCAPDKCHKTPHRLIGMFPARS